MSLRLLSRESSDDLCVVGMVVLSFLSHIAALSVRLARFAGGSAILLEMSASRLGSRFRDMTVIVARDPL